MPAFTISDAARHCGVDRRTLQRAVSRGALTLTADHLLTPEALAQAGYHPAAPQETTPDAAGMPQWMRHDAPAPQDMPQELTLATTLLTHLAELTSTIAALHQEVILLREDLRQTPQRRPRIPWGTPQADAAPMPHHATLTPQETPQVERHAAAVQPADAAPMPHGAAAVPHHDALTPEGDAAGTPQDVRHASVAPHAQPATAESPTTLPPYILRIAEVAMQYDKLTLGELAQLLYDRNLYRARDRKSGAEKPVNRGTLQRWLEQARQAGAL